MTPTDYVIERQLKPEARRDVIAAIRKNGLTPTAMIDVSDGLSSELLHICKQSGTGVKIYENKLPVDAQTEAVAAEMNMDATMLAMNGGEDYELLFTIPAEQVEIAGKMQEISIIGQITDEPEVYTLIGRNAGSARISAQGWNAYGNGKG